MSRKRSEEDSSLELLLDTMCNTFGGVMFIAISLAVMISMRSAVSSVQEDYSAEKLASLQKELATLQQVFTVKKQETERLALAVKNMSNDPRLILVNEIAFLEQKLKERLLEVKLKEQKRLLIQTQLTDILSKNLKIANALKESKEKNIVLEKEIKIFEEELDKQKKILSVLVPKNLVFNTMVEKNLAPYYIIVNEGKVWKVGPEISGDSYKPDSAVKLEIRGGIYYCHPIAGRGTEIFDNDDFSGEFLMLIQNLPKDRVPEFVISKNDAEVFAKMREKLKKQKIFHGFSVQKKENDVFGYHFMNNDRGKYEY
ncbi:MAG: hypothetical protein J6S53_04500 [Lentisphaeria bacterium]|nr:hypothetical protein [Lentisphaeria bacterium]